MSTDLKTQEEGVLSFFPLSEPRSSQAALILAIDAAFKEPDCKFVVLQAPVGSGKSAIAITLARAMQSAHILTPRKSLQDQYFDDFKEQGVVLMKGRSSYPCIEGVGQNIVRPVIKAVKDGKVKPPPKNSPNCSEAPCVGNKQVYEACTTDRDCPYSLASAIAQQNPIVVHNLHSFIFQTSFSDKFQTRPLLVIDEAHDIEGILTGFSTLEILLHAPISEKDRNELHSPEQWYEKLSSPSLIPEETVRDKRLKEENPNYISAQAAYLASLVKMTTMMEKGVSVECPKPAFGFGSVLVIPHSISNVTDNLLFSYGEKVLLMSGTIYNVDMFCASLGIPREKTRFFSTASTFPVENRPVYLKPAFQTDTSHARWEENFPEVVRIIKEILSKFPDVKGLIHSPSYSASTQIINAVRDPRLKGHTSADFQEKLEEFFKDPSPSVFVSPTCYQGVDFKEDRGRFQIVVRIPYPSMMSQYVKDRAEKNFQWYNYQALVAWGQQLGRVNRSESDFGVTILLDSRFQKFIQRNRTWIPAWVQKSFVFR